MPVQILPATTGSQYPADVKIIRVPCSCRVNPMFILRAFQRGADGVILCGCHPGDCHYTSGNYYTRRRMALLFSMLDYLGIERERTRVEWVSAAEGAKFAATMNDFAENDRFFGRKQETGGSAMQKVTREALIKRACELLADGTVDRVLGWKAGEFDYDVTPALFHSAEELERDFVFGRFLRCQLLQVLGEGNRQKRPEGSGVPEALRYLQL